MLPSNTDLRSPLRRRLAHRKGLSRSRETEEMAADFKIKKCRKTSNANDDAVRDHKKGDDNDKLFIVLSGTAEVLGQEELLLVMWPEEL